MRLTCPPDMGSINVGGVEYTAVDGYVDITDPAHIAAAESIGFGIPVLDQPVTTGE